MLQDEKITLYSYMTISFEKQNLLLSYMVSNQELYIKVSPIIKAGYFDPRLKNAVKFIQMYFEEFRSPPNIDQIRVETQISLDKTEKLTRQELQYTEQQLEQFCKESAINDALIRGPALVNEGKYGEVEKMIRDAITISLNRNLGTDYFADPESRLKILAMAQNTVPTLFTKLDHYLNGGINRKEMIIFAAPPGVGKSITMANIGRNLMKQGLTGVYITLELSEEVTAKRFDSMFSGIAQADILRNITEASIRIKTASNGLGKLFIKRFPESSTTANHIRAYLKEFEIMHGFTPDFMIIDYMDLMASNQAVSAENTFIKDKYIAEEIRALANDYNMLMITASQLNRGAQLLENIEDLGQAHMAGGISKVNTADNLVAIIQTPQMKARGEMMYKLLKTRSSNGVGNYFMMRFNSVTLIIDNIEEQQDDNSTAKLAKTISSYVKNKNGNKDEAPEEPPVIRARPKKSTDDDSAPGLSINNIPFQI